MIILASEFILESIDCIFDYTCTLIHNWINSINAYHNIVSLHACVLSILSIIYAIDYILYFIYGLDFGERVISGRITSCKLRAC